MGRRRTRLVWLTDGPLEGLAIAASVVPPIGGTFGVGALAADPHTVERHEYRRTSEREAAWVRRLGLFPLPQVHGTPEFRRAH